MNRTVVSVREHAAVALHRAAQRVIDEFTTTNDTEVYEVSEDAISGLSAACFGFASAFGLLEGENNPNEDKKYGDPPRTESDWYARGHL